MTNEMEVQLLNITKYTTKDNRNRCILRFILLDKESMVANGNFKGITILETYYNGDVFDKIPLSKFGTKVTITTKTIPSENNPLVSISNIVKIDDISLV